MKLKIENGKWKIGTKALPNSQFSTLNSQLKSGQALVVLLVFIAAAITITGAAVTITLINSQATSKFAIGEEALAVAEAGAENAVLKLLRNPAYSGSIINDSVPVGTYTAQTSTSGSPAVTITSTGQVGDFIRKVQIIGTYSANQFTMTSWQQID